MVKLVDILIPTYNRHCALAITLTSLVAQSFPNFSVIISDQSDTIPVSENEAIQSVINVLRFHNQPVTVLRNFPRRGMAHQRQFLLDQAHAPYVLFLDDDVIMEAYVLENMVNAIVQEQCGFVGSALAGLTYIDDHRPHQQAIEYWDGPVKPEQVRPGDAAWNRHQLHNAANMIHSAQAWHATPEQPKKYKVAWVGGCVLFDTAKLRRVGGFSFWEELPEAHAGEDVLAQLRVMDSFGGCGLLPSGVYHLQLPTTLPDRSVDAPKVLDIEKR